MRETSDLTGVPAVVGNPGALQNAGISPLWGSPLRPVPPGPTCFAHELTPPSVRPPSLPWQAVTSDDGVVRAYDLEETKMVAELRGHGDAVQAVVFDPFGKFCVTASSDHSFRLWS